MSEPVHHPAPPAGRQAGRLDASSADLFQASASLPSLRFEPRSPCSFCSSSFSSLFFYSVVALIDGRKSASRSCLRNRSHPIFTPCFIHAFASDNFMCDSGVSSQDQRQAGGAAERERGRGGWPLWFPQPLSRRVAPCKCVGTALCVTLACQRLISLNM